MNRPEGGHAFPRPGDGRFSASDGMSLRDYFAAKAMLAEMITSLSDATPAAADALMDAADAAGRTPEEHIAYLSYRLADAMIAQRAK